MRRLLVCLVSIGVVLTATAHAQTAGTVDPTFEITLGGTFRGVRCAERQLDGKIVIAGDFTSVNGVTRNRVARLNADGTLDTTFNPGWGADKSIDSIAVQENGDILLGGQFTTVGGTTHLGVARLRGDGSVDSSFNASVYGDRYTFILALVVQPDGKILLGGNITAVNGVSRQGIARLDPDGSLDSVFEGTMNYVSSIVLQPDDQILVADRSGLSRLSPNGVPDAGFVVRANNSITAMALQPDGRILIGGYFTSVMVLAGRMRPGSAQMADWMSHSTPI